MFPRDMVCLRNICVGTLHKDDTEDDDDDDDNDDDNNNNNNNNTAVSGLVLLAPFTSTHPSLTQSVPTVPLTI